MQEGSRPVLIKLQEYLLEGQVKTKTNKPQNAYDFMKVLCQKMSVFISALTILRILMTCSLEFDCYFKTLIPKFQMITSVKKQCVQVHKYS